MAIRNFVHYFILIMSLSACNRLEDKARQLGDKVKSKSKQLIKVVIDKGVLNQKPESFSIRSMVEDYKTDKSIIEIEGIRTDNNFFYTNYCVYKGQKDRVLKGVNKIFPKKVNDHTSDNKCYPVNKQRFYHDVAPNERTKQTAFFWNFEKLESFEIYTCIKAPWRHYVIFDKNSDTVYHRIDEIRD